MTNAARQYPIVWRTEFSILAVLLLVTLIDRVPYSFQSVIDWDESTHLLLGRYTLQGLIPYVDLIEIKPPGVFAAFSVFAFLADDSIFLLRMIGALCVLTMAWLTYRSVELFCSTAAALAAGCLVILAIGSLGSGQSTETSIVAGVPLTAGIYLLLKEPKTIRTYFAMGLLFSLSVSVRSELIIFAILITIYILANALSARTSLRVVAAYVLGAALPVGVFLFFTLVEGNFDDALFFNVTMALEYSQQSSLGQAFFGGANNWFEFSLRLPFLFGVFPIFVLGGYWALFDTAKRSSHSASSDASRVGMLTRTRAVALLVATFGVFVSILLGGESDTRHWSKIIPLLAIAGSGLVAIQAAAIPKRIGTHILSMMVVPALILSLLTAALFADKAIQGRYARGDERRAATYLSGEISDTDRLLALDGHVVYLWLDRKPLGPIVHPSHFSRKYFMDALVEHGYLKENEFDRLLSSSPEYILVRKKNPYLRKAQKEKLQLLLSARYELIEKFGRLQLYKRDPS